MDQVPETPMVIEAFNGNIEGTNLGITPPGGLFGIPENDTLNYPNHVGYSSEFQLVVNMAGALGDISWINESDNVPLINFHLPTDPFAPYNDDVLIVPTTGDRIVQVQGAQAIVGRVNELGLNQVFIDAGIDDEFTQRAQAASAEAGHEYFEGLFPFIRPLNALGNGEGDPWQWWDSELWSTVVFDTIGGNVITFEQSARNNNFDAGPEKARIYIDSIIGYFAPRAFAALDLENAGTKVSTSLLETAQVGLTVAPNPGQQFITFQTDSAFPIQAIQVFDLQGRIVRSYSNLNQNSFNLVRESLSDGIYVAKLKFEEGIVTQKLIFN